MGVGLIYIAALCGAGVVVTGGTMGTVVLVAIAVLAIVGGSLLSYWDKPGAAERFSPASFGFGVGSGYFSAFVTLSVSG